MLQHFFVLTTYLGNVGQIRASYFPCLSNQMIYVVMRYKISLLWFVLVYDRGRDKSVNQNPSDLL